MSVLFKLSLWLFMSIIVLSCQDRPSQIHRVLKEPNLREFAEKMGVTCVNQETCSASVGNFVVYQPVKDLKGTGYNINFGNCTGSLIAEDLVITNRHCFIERNIKVGDSCPTIFVKFPKVREHEEVLSECKQIVFYPDIQPKTEEQKIQNLDVAIIQLKSPVKRPVLKTSNEGFKNNDLVTIHRFTTQQTGSRLDTLTCPVVQDAAIVDFSRLASSQNSAFVYLANCTVIESNSGSPMLDEKGHLKGVVSLFIDSTKVKQTFPDAAKNYKDATGGINLACVNYPLISGQRNLPPECALTLDWSKQKELSASRLKELQINRVDLLKTKADEFETKVARQFELSYGPAKTEDFGFLDFLSTNKIYWFYPSCVQNAEQLKAVYSSLSSIPIFYDETTFNEAGHIHEKISIESLRSLDMKVEVLSENQIYLRVKGRLLDKNVNYSQLIDLCGK